MMNNKDLFHPLNITKITTLSAFFYLPQMHKSPQFGNGEINMKFEQKIIIQEKLDA